MRGWASMVAISALAMSACLQSGVQHCDNGSRCAADRVCSPHGGCVLPEQLDACDGQPEQTACTLPGASMGACFDGVCLPIGCGNGVLEPGEACDDGNTLSGDGCSRLCDSTERCGNAFLDVTTSEQCDCGDASVVDDNRPPGCNGPNSDAAGATCRADCTLLGCGDGVANGLEDCDGTDVRKTCVELGYYGGTIGCLASCRYDLDGCTGTCGDGVRNSLPGQPLEVCDGNDLANLDCTDLGFYQPDALTCNPACFFDTTQCSERCGDGLVNGPEACDEAPPAGLSCATAGHDAGQLGCAAACYETLEHCRDVGITLEYANGVTDLEGVWGIGTEFFACGGSTGVLHSAGGAWTPMPGSPAGIAQCDLWGTSATNVFLVKNSVSAGWSLYHYDGTSWTQMAGPAAPPQGLLSIWGTSASSVYAVGGSGTVVHFDGTTWQSVVTPIPATARVTGVWASGPDDVFVVGLEGVRFHWNGSVWVDQSTATMDSFQAVWGQSSTEVYAVSSNSVWRYDGTTWATVTSFGGTQLTDVGGIPGGPTVVVGYSFFGGTLMVQNLGGVWVSTNPGPIGSMSAVHGTNERFYGVGADGIARWSGASWIPATPIAPPLQHGIWAGAYNDMYITGGNDSTGDGWLGHFDGSLKVVSVGAGFLFDVWGDDPTNIVAVGANGRALHGSGTSFASKTTPTTETLRAVWGTGTIFYAVGTLGTVLRWSGNKWFGETSTTTAVLFDVWGTDAEVFAVGELGTILHRTGGSWAPMMSPTTTTLSGLWGRSASDVFAVGGNGTILHFDGTTWTAMPSGTTQNLTSVWGSTGEVFATGPGIALQYVGGRWLPFLLKTPITQVAALAGTADFMAFYTTSGIDVLSGRLFRPPVTETACGDQWDDDDDGATDCADPDCAADAACVAPGACHPIVDVACGQMISSTTIGGAVRFPYFGQGCSTKDEGGPEAYVRVRRPSSGTIQLDLSGYTGDLDLIVSGSSPQGACIADEQCLAASQTSGATEQVGFPAAANADYIVIVDGSAGAASAFTLAVSCP